MHAYLLKNEEKSYVWHYGHAITTMHALMSESIPTHDTWVVAGHCLKMDDNDSVLCKTYILVLDSESMNESKHSTILPHHWVKVFSVTFLCNINTTYNQFCSTIYFGSREKFVISASNLRHLMSLCDT